MAAKPNRDLRVSPRAVSVLTMAVALAALFFSGLAAHAQVLYGSMTGTVTDKTGAVVPNVTVTITNQGTNEVRSVKANDVGGYQILDVLPGMYSVSVAQSGNFGAFTEKNVDVVLNHQVRVDIVLQPAAVTQQVTVNEAPPALQTQTADVSADISETQLGQLPITSSAGRSYQALYTIIPGAANVKEQNSTASNPSRAMSLNVNGMNFNNNSTRIDGAMNYYGWLPYLIAYVPPAESVDTVNIDTNSFNAEQGLAGGAAINVTTKSGGHDFHGTAWWYYQDAGLSARGYTQTQSSFATVPKNVFDQYGFNIGGPVYIPRILTGKKKLFFFDNFERTTRRQLITGTVTVPDAKMLTGDFSEVAGLFPIYDPGTGPSYTSPASRTQFSGNIIPSDRISPAAATMLATLQPISSTIQPTATQLTNQLLNDYNGFGTLAYNRNTNDAKITYIPNDNTQIFGKYSIEPFTVDDPQTLQQAGGGTFDGGQPGAASGRIQNVGLGISRTFGANIVLDADFGYTRQVTGAQSTIDQKLGDYGLDTLKIPGTNGAGPNYEGQPYFAMGTVSSNGSTTGFSSIGNANGASPFLFRDNQFTGDVNLSWIKGRHTMKFGFTYYHFDLNHFQPTSGGGISNVRGGFAFQGGMTVGPGDTDAKGDQNVANSYTALADFLLGLPNQTGQAAVAKALQIANPNALRWTEIGVYAQDQWQVTPDLTLNYGVRYEMYPPAYRDHTGIYILDPNLPQSANVEIGGVNGEPKNAGISVGYGNFVPRVGVAYRINDKTVIRSGFGMTTDPESFRWERDAFPMDVDPNYYSASANTIAIDPANNNAPMVISGCGSSSSSATNCYGIPAAVIPNFSTGFASLPISGGTTTATKDFHRGYIESWNLFVQRDLGRQFVGNVGYVGVHDVRQFVQTGYLNAAPLPTADTPCMANGHYNPTITGQNGPCNANVNEIVNVQWCGGTSACYNTGGIGMVEPLFGANYNALQTQLTYRGGTSKQLGVVYTWSHAIDFEDNGAGSGSGGLSWNYPAYYNFNRANAGFDQTHNLEIWGIYNLPFGRGHRLAQTGVANWVLGGWQLNGQYSHISGTPFTVSASGNTLNTPGAPLYAQLVSAYHQIGGHARSAGSSVSSGKLWFDPTSFANPVEPSFCAQGDANCTTPNGTATTPAATPVFGNSNRNEFRGPGVSYANASIFRAFTIYREAQFQIRFEAFNITNHPQLTSNPGTTVGSSSLGTITSFGNTRSLQFSGRFQF